jgi:DNA-binding NarL/FixJ family response regulator
VPTVLIADAHHLFRHGLADLIRMTLGDSVDVLEADNLADACEMIEASEQLDLVVCDFSLAGSNPFGALEELTALTSGAPVVALADSKDVGVVRQMLASGARGYVMKCERAQHIRLALEMILAGGTYVPAEIFCQATPGEDKWSSTTCNAAPGDAVQAVEGVSFTDRELAVLRRIMRGVSNKEIARDLSIAESTVKIHVRSICRKSGTKNRTQAALFAEKFLANPEPRRMDVTGKLINLPHVAERTAN